MQKYESEKRGVKEWEGECDSWSYSQTKALSSMEG